MRLHNCFRSLFWKNLEAHCFSFVLMFCRSQTKKSANSERQDSSRNSEENKNRYVVSIALSKI